MKNLIYTLLMFATCFSITSCQSCLGPKHKIIIPNGEHTERDMEELKARGVIIKGYEPSNLDPNYLILEIEKPSS